MATCYHELEMADCALCRPFHIPAPPTRTEEPEPRKLTEQEQDSLYNLNSEVAGKASARLAFLEKRVARLSHDIFGGDSGLMNEFDRMDAALSTLRGQIEGMREWLKLEASDPLNTVNERGVAESALKQFNATFPAEKGRS